MRDFSSSVQLKVHRNTTHLRQAQHHVYAEINNELFESAQPALAALSSSSLHAEWALPGFEGVEAHNSALWVCSRQPGSLHT